MYRVRRTCDLGFLVSKPGAFATIGMLRNRGTQPGLNSTTLKEG